MIGALHFIQFLFIDIFVVCCRCRCDCSKKIFLLFLVTFIFIVYNNIYDGSLFSYCFFDSFTDALRIVKDRKYGAKNADEVGNWDGMVGELVRRVSIHTLQYVIFSIYCIFFIEKKNILDKLICIKIRGKPLFVNIIENDETQRHFLL